MGGEGSCSIEVSLDICGGQTEIDGWIWCGWSGDDDDGMSVVGWPFSSQLFNLSISLSLFLFIFFSAFCSLSLVFVSCVDCTTHACAKIK